MIVWVLLLYFTGGPHVVDGINSQANCEALAEVVRSDYQQAMNIRPAYRCIAVRKRVNP